MDNKVCAVCGKEFESEQWNAKYCSAECRKIGLKPSMKKSYAKYVKRKAEERKEKQKEIVGICEICGSPVYQKTGRRKYCSNECYTISKNEAAAKYRFKMSHEEMVHAELKEIRKKSHLNRNLKDLKKNSESLGIKSYDYGKYALMKGL